MFKWIKNKIRKKKRNDLQFRQKIILLAQVGEYLFEGIEDESSYGKNISFDIDVQDESYMKLKFLIDDSLLEYDIRTSDESIVYLINFVESLHYMEEPSEICYVSSTDNTKQFIRLFFDNNENITVTFVLKDENENLRAKSVQVNPEIVRHFIDLNAGYIPVNLDC